MFATNVIGTHYLTVLLLPILQKSTPSRIVNVASGSHLVTKYVNTSIEKLNDESYYNRILQYGRTKVINNTLHVSLMFDIAILIYIE